MSDKPSVVEALSRVMRDVQAVGKKDRNTEQNYSFRGIDATVNAVGPALREHGVVILPMLEKASYRDVQTSRGKPSRESTVEVRFRFYGPQGDWLEAVVPGEAMDFGDKGVAKAMSVAYRIVLLQALCIPTDEADADSHTYERSTGEWEAARPTRRTASEIRGEIAQLGKDKGMHPDVLAADFEGWSKGVHIGVTEDVRLLSEYLDHLRKEAS